METCYNQVAMKENTHYKDILHTIILLQCCGNRNTNNIILTLHVHVHCGPLKHDCANKISLSASENSF